MSERIEQFWRQATADDVARVMRGETVEARFRDFESDEWMVDVLCGYCSMSVSGCNWIEQAGNGYIHCQVYDPPAWFVNKPDPGKGYRLLEKFPPEGKEAGDEWFSCKTNDWVYAGSSKIQRSNVWYRRRIEANSPGIPDSSNSSEIPNSCCSRDTIPSGWRVLSKDEERLASDAYWSNGCDDWLVIGDDRVAIANSREWHAIRQVEYQADYALVDGYIYHLPNGSKIRITAKGFEVV